MDFTIHTDWIDLATKPYSEAADGDTIVATTSFYYGSTFVPRGAAATYRNGNITELADGQQFALDGLGDLPVSVIPNRQRRRRIGESEPHMVPDVIDRADVEQAIREFASEVGYPGHAQRLIDRLPKPESPDEERTVQLRIRWNPDNESDPVGWDWQTLIDSDGLRCAVLEVTSVS